MRLLLLCTCFATIIATTVSCKKDARVAGSLSEAPQPPPPPPPPGPTVAPTGKAHAASFTFFAIANGAVLVPATKTYTNESGDSLTVTKFNYYVSNLKFHRADGSHYAVPESYHLIRHVEGQTAFDVDSVPDGKYTHLSFLIGVDSIRNVSGAQTGALDPVHGMFWDWNTGYIFYKLEGSYRSPQMSSNHEYGLHVGGFSGEDHCLRTATLQFAAPVNLARGSKSSIQIHASVDEVFKSPIQTGFEDYYAAVPHGPRIFRVLADNYADMFSIAGVQITQN